MAVSATNAFDGPLTASGVTPIPFTFSANRSDEVSVILNGVAVPPDQFIVALNGDGTGSVTPLSAWSGTVFVYSSLSFTQGVTFERYGPYFPDQFSDALDTLGRQNIWLKDRVDALFPSLDPTVRAGYVLGFDAQGAPTLTTPGGADSALRADLAASSGVGLLGWLRAATGAVIRSVGDWLEDEWSVMDFIPFSTRVQIRLRTSTTDISSYAIAATTALAAKGGGDLKWPLGTYRSTNAIPMQQGVNHIGAGFGTVVQFYGCNGFTYGYTTGFGNSQIKNLTLQGNGGSGDNYFGIGQPGTNNSADQLLGLSFDNLLIRGFDRGLTFRNVGELLLGQAVWVQDCKQGLALVGQVLNARGYINVIKAAGVGTSASTGVRIAPYNFTTGGLIAPEGIRLAVRTYGFDTGVDLDSCVSWDLKVDIDAAVRGIRIGTARAWEGLITGSVRMNGASSLAGVYFDSLSTPAGNNVTLENMHCEGTGHTANTSIAFQVGQTSGGNQNGVRLIGCSASGFTRHDAAFFASGRGSIRDCDFRSVTTNNISIYTENVGTASGVNNAGKKNIDTVTIDGTRCAGTIQVFGSDIADGAVVMGTNIVNGSTRSVGSGVGTVASAATVTLPAQDIVTVTGTTGITSITADYAGRRVTLIFAAALTLTDGSNLKLAGNFVTTADDAISLICDGTNWIETSRSVN